jgi:predicted short-subunit dehydrogenase-like oxidoreductase (DUF2520 family)
MIKVVLLGTGNVARFLFNGFKEQTTVKIIQVVGRNKEDLDYFKANVPVEKSFQKLMTADVYIMALKDDAIASVAASLRIKEGLLVHTSGSVSIEAIPAKVRRGVLYPLQTFSKTELTKGQIVPFCIEAEEIPDYKILTQMALTISDTVQKISSSQRKYLHLAAVFANNFTNHMYHAAYTICEENKVPFSILEPLINETSLKIKTQSPFEAQTGPALRGDQETIKKHLSLLTDTRVKEIYSLLSQSIQDTYEDKL